MSNDLRLISGGIGAIYLRASEVIALDEEVYHNGQEVVTTVFLRGGEKFSIRASANVVYEQLYGRSNGSL